MFEDILYYTVLFIGHLSEYYGRLPLIFASTASLLYPTSTVEKRGDASLNPCNVELESEESIVWRETYG